MPRAMTSTKAAEELGVNVATLTTRARTAERDRGNHVIDGWIEVEHGVFMRRTGGNHMRFRIEHKKLDRPVTEERLQEILREILPEILREELARLGINVPSPEIDS